MGVALRLLRFKQRGADFTNLPFRREDQVIN